MDFSEIMKQANKIQDQMKSAKENLVKIECEGNAGGGLVKLTLNGESNIVKIDIDNSIIEMISNFSPKSWLVHLSRGIIDIPGVFYFILVSTTALTGTTWICNNRSQGSISKQSWLKGSLITILFFIVPALLIMLSKAVPGEWDLTAENEFTLHKGSYQILDKLNSDTRVTLYWSNSELSVPATIKSHADRAQQMLKRLARESKGKLTLEIIDPKPFTDQEDLANVYGVQGLQINEEGERFYFGAVVSNSVDDTTVIPFFDLGRERFLEYDLTKTIYNLANTKKPTIGLISGLPFIGGVSNSQEGPQYQEPFYLHTRILELFKVQDLTPSITSIPKDIDQLLVIHPKDLSDETLYAIDQFVMSGKGVIFFVDPFSEHEKNRGIISKISFDLSILIVEFNIVLIF